MVRTDDSLDAPRPTVVSTQGRSFRLAVADLHHGIDVVGRIKVTPKFDVRNARVRKEIGQVIHDKRHEFDSPSNKRARGAAPEPSDQEAQISTLRRELTSHPCHGCPDREDHARWAERYFRAMRDRDRVVGEISRATGSIARVFDKRCDVLRELGYLAGVGEETMVTPSGESLRTLYSENDLVMAECLREGIWDRLHPPALAATVSSLLYRGRREDDIRTPRIPGGPRGVLGLALADSQRIWARLDDLQRTHGLPELPPPHWGLVSSIHGWAQGKGLDEVLGDTDIAPGDMVRWCKQVIDVLEQVAQSATSEKVRASAQDAVDAMRRGVVAY